MLMFSAVNSAGKQLGNVDRRAKHVLGNIFHAFGTTQTVFYSKLTYAVENVVFILAGS